MAGKNTRFHDVGYDVPKYLLPIFKETVISHILKNLTRENAFKKIYLIAHKRDRSFFSDLLNAVEKYGLDESNVYFLDETNGQAETAFHAICMISDLKQNPIVFHNADTVLIGRSMSELLANLNGGYGCIDVFKATSKKYSYVTIKNNFVTNILEKKVISEWASSGLYGFTSGNIFKKYFLESRINDNNTEIYISDVIHGMITAGEKFLPIKNTLEEDYNSTLVLGSPEEYLATLAGENLWRSNG